MVRSSLIVLSGLAGIVEADYAGTEYWDSRYEKRGNEVFQWLQDEDDIESHLSSFLSHFNIHNQISRIVELGYGTSNMAHNVLYKSTKFGPEFQKLIDEGENNNKDNPVNDKGIVTGNTIVPRTVVTVDYSTVAHQQQIERRNYTPEKYPGLYYISADIYDFLQILSNQVNGNPENTEPADDGTVVSDSRLKAGHWVSSSRPVDLVFDSSVLDTLIIQGIDDTMKGQKGLFDSMNPDHGAWLSVSFGAPESRLYVYQAQAWDKIIVCRPLTLGTNHLYWLLRGEMWSKIELKENQQLGKYTCNDSSYYKKSEL